MDVVKHRGGRPVAPADACHFARKAAPRRRHDRLFDLSRQRGWPFRGNGLGVSLARVEPAVEPWKLTSGPGNAADASPLVAPALCAAESSLVNSTAAQLARPSSVLNLSHSSILQTGPRHAAARNRRVRTARSAVRPAMQRGISRRSRRRKRRRPYQRLMDHDPEEICVNLCNLRTTT